MGSMVQAARRPALLAAGRYFRENPQGTIEPGLWWGGVWDRAAFRRWFWGCLHAKIDRHDARQWRKLTRAYQVDLAWDAHVINLAARGVYHPGRNVLRTPDMKRRYPHVDNTEEVFS